MDRYLTVMIIPEREKKVRSFRIPRIVYRSFSFIFMLLLMLLGILAYDYYQILQQVYRNKHLTIENRQLKDQIQLFQMKLNNMTDDLKRLHTFEQKVSIMTGLKEMPSSKSQGLEADEENSSGGVMESFVSPKGKEAVSPFQDFQVIDLSLDTISKRPKFRELKKLYEEKMARSFGMQSSYAVTKDWSNLTRQSFTLSGQFAQIDYVFEELAQAYAKLEVQINQLDTYLLDKESMLKSTPSLLPSKGWVTSYYGPRFSPYSGKLKMHEGLDVGAIPGEKIIAPADGVVVFAGARGSFGNNVQIDHGYGIETIYAHASTLKVRAGQTVKRGELLALVGSTGASTGPHLHYEVRVNGTPVDPFYYILN